MVAKHDYFTKKFLYNELEFADILNLIVTKIPYNRSMSGYGSKIPTKYMIRTSDKRIHRVYAICYSNTASLYIKYKNTDCMVETAMDEFHVKQINK